MADDLRDVWNRILGLGVRRTGPTSGRPMQTSEFVILKQFPAGDGAEFGWRCMSCMQSGTGSEDLCRLGIGAHAADCTPPTDVAYARFELVQEMSYFSRDVYGRPWSSEVEHLVLTGGVWALAADLLGWPVGYFGLAGWDTLDEAAARRGRTRATLFMPLSAVPDDQKPAAADPLYQVEDPWQPPRIYPSY